MEKKYKLPKDFATKWVSALRSGEYKQTSGKLCDGDKHYCCIGVAGLVLGLDDNILIRNADKKLTQLVFGVKIPSIIDNSALDLQFELITLNDSMGQNFNKIADWIEQNVEFI